MDRIVLSAFRDTVEFLPAELKVMPLSRWNESVLRYFFCRSLSEAHPEVEQFVECERIDLVLAHEQQRAFIEFKLYLQSPRFDPYAGRTLGFKGGPSAKNLSEFRSCVDQLHARAAQNGLSKFVVLGYADLEGTPRRLRYSTSYDDYRHSSPEVAIRLLDSVGPMATHEGVLQAKLYEVD